MDELSQAELTVRAPPDPKYYKKKLKIMPIMFKNLSKEEKETMTKEISLVISDDLGTFGDIVNKAREELSGEWKMNNQNKSKVNTRTRDLIKQPTISVGSLDDNAEEMDEIDTATRRQ